MVKCIICKSCIVVVEEAETTVTLGLELVYSAADLSDASIETLIEKINNDILAGTVAALTIAVDMVEVSDDVVVAIYEKAQAVRVEAEAAKAELDTAKAELEALQLQTPGGKALMEASERLEVAVEKYDALTKEVAKLDACLEDAEDLRAQAQVRYEELKAAEDEFNAPASPEGGVLPTPGVEYVPTAQTVVVVLPDGTEVSVDVDFDEEGQVPEVIEVNGVTYRRIAWRIETSETGEVIGAVPVYEEVVVEEPTVPETPVEPEQPSTPSTPVVIPVVVPVVTPVVEEVVVEEVVVEDVVETPVVEEIVEIEDEETPLADGAVEIEDEEVPLASNTEEASATPVVAAVAGSVAAVAVGLFFFLRRKASN